MSLVPFVGFIVLAGNAIATTSDTDLALLSSALSILAPVAERSATIKKMHDACCRFSRIASLIVASAREAPMDHNDPQTEVSSGGLPLDDSTAPSISTDCGFPMAVQDWDNVMMGFESELGDYDSRTLANIMEPYFVNAGW